LASGYDQRSRLSTALFAFVAVLMAVLAIGGSALAQDDGDEAVEESAETIGGTLRAKDEAGEDLFIEGVTFTVTDADGNVVSTAVTDADGVWLVPLPGPGVYSVELDEATLGEGLSLRNPDKNPLTDIEVQPGTKRNTLFPLGERIANDDNTIRAVQLFADGIKLGLIIAMCAIGLSLIYGTTGLTNFAHGEMVTFGAMIAFIWHVVWEVSWLGSWMSSLVVSAVVAVLVTGVAGWLFNEVVWKRLRNKGASLVSALVVSIGLSIFLRYVMLYQFRGRARFYRDYRIGDSIDFGIFTLLRKDIFIIVFSTLILVGVGLALQKTRLGKAMRAVSDNRDLAESSGIDVEKVIRWVWIVGSALAGLGGVLFGLTENVNWEMGFRLLLLMFAGVTLGGLGTAYGALFGSIIAGVFIQMSTLVIPGDMKNIGALVALVLILLVRPQGLLGRAERIG
jgi:branched-chain amino acid transport system permease protein